MEVLKMFSIYRYKAAQIERNQTDKSSIEMVNNQVVTL